MERLTKNGLVVLLLAPWLAVVDCTVMCYRPKVPVPLIDARNASDSLPRRDSASTCRLCVGVAL